MDNTSEQKTFGQLAADFAHDHIGSWTFLFLLSVAIWLWIIYNELSPRPFDPAPFIELNLFLSLLAAVQAPLIMISQKSQDLRQQAVIDAIALVGQATMALTAATKEMLEDHLRILQQERDKHDSE